MKGGKEDFCKISKSVLEDLKLDVELHRYRAASRRLGDLAPIIPMSSIPEMALVYSILKFSLWKMQNIFVIGIPTPRELKDLHQSFLAGLEIIIKALSTEVDRVFLLLGLSDMAYVVTKMSHRLRSEDRDLDRIITERRQELERLLPKGVKGD